MRRYDRRNSCIFCGKLVLKLRRHLLNNHKNEQVIAEYVTLFKSCPEKSKDKRRKIIADLTLRGNNIYNKSLLKDTATREIPYDGILPVKRPPKDKKVLPSDYIICTICTGLFFRKHFYQHASQCKKKYENKTINSDSERGDCRRRKTNFIKEYGIQYCPNATNVLEEMQRNILKILRKDDIGIKAMRVIPVSYTHLDVYKRQRLGFPGLTLPLFFIF